MLPVLFKVGSITIYTYGIFVALALFWFLYIAWRHVRITKHKEEEVFDRVFLGMLAGLFFGRLFYMLFHLDVIFKKGIIAFFAFHLYPGIHGFSVILFMGAAIILLLAREKKYSGTEILAYLTPALFVFLAILSVGGLFAGTDVGVVTTFPLKIKYALYGGLRHAPGLYDAVVFLIGALAFHKLVLVSRQGRVGYGLIVSLFYWVLSLTHLVTSQFRDVITYQKVSVYRAFDIYLSIFILLTSLIFVMYYLRSHFGILVGSHSNKQTHKKHG